jgi:thymidylate kinase
VNMRLAAEDEALLARLPESLRARNGVPSGENDASRERAAEIARAVLGDLLRPDGLRTSILGPAWSGDVDAHLTRFPDPARLEALGWINIDGLLERLGHRGKGRWAIVEDGVVLGLADLTLEPVQDRVISVIARCRRKGEVRAREVLELRALRRVGATFPSADPVLAMAASIEAGLGGELLAPWKDGPALPAPATLPMSRGRSFVKRLRRSASRLRPGRCVVVAISGLDGAGKSTLARTLAGDLRRVRLPVNLVWTRPGMRLRWLGNLGRAAKRLLRQDTSTGVERIGRGEGAGSVASRHGALGWIWALMVTLSFIRQIRKGRRRGRAVFIYDRHLLDALVTLDVVYEGVRLGVHKSLVRLLVPRADVTLLLVVPPAIALVRKPDDMFVEAVLERQAQRYAACRDEASEVLELDGTRPLEGLAAEAFRLVAGIQARH